MCKSAIGGCGDNVVIRNNTVYNGIPGQRSAWSISNNVWVGVKNVPINCTDTSATITSLAFNSSATSPAAACPKRLSPTDFYLGASSPARGVGVALASVKTDYNGYARASKPSVGFVEYGTQANSGDGGDGSPAAAATGFFLAVVRTVSELLPV